MLSKTATECVNFFQVDLSPNKDDDCLLISLPTLVDTRYNSSTFTIQLNKLKEFWNSSLEKYQVVYKKIPELQNDIKEFVISISKRSDNNKLVPSITSVLYAYLKVS